MLTRDFAKMIVICASVLSAPVLQASEISMVSGLYQGEDYKTGGKDDGGKSSMSLGVRYAEPLTDVLHWFGQGALTLRSFEAPEGKQAPSDSTSIGLAGGVRLYFPEFSQVITPFFSANGRFLSEKDGTIGITATETETTGLFYGGSVGFRFEVATDFFAELESVLFDSALFGTTVTDNGTTKSEVHSVDLFVASQSSVLNATVAIGMRL